MKKVLKQTAKKIYKARLFYDIKTEGNRITFKNCHNVLFCFDLTPDKGLPNLGIFHAGYVREWQELAPTYESEYNALGMVDRASYNPFFIQQTDNPDFILRASITITLQ